MGPAVLITLGLLFLLANTSSYPFQRTWPILLIVIGAIKLVRYVVPDSGHVNPGQYPTPYAVQDPPPCQPVAPPQAGFAQNGAQNEVQTEAPASGPLVTPPPAPMAGALGDGNGDNGDEVRNG